MGVFMFFRRKKEKKVQSNITDSTYIMCSTKEIIRRNLIAGIARGVGITIGVTLITATLIWILQRLIKLNIPVLGEYIADLIDIIESNR